MFHSLRQASKDDLTSLYGREGFKIWWKENRCGRDYQHGALFIVDVDDFKNINDNYGHNIGDKVLQAVALELRRMVRYDNQVCRWGGDEFVGVLPGDHFAVESRLNLMRDKVYKATKEIGAPVTLSIGYAEVSANGLSQELEDLLEKADNALYKLKKNGKNGIDACY